MNAQIQDNTPYKKDLQVRRIISYIDKAYADQITLKSLQQTFHLNQYHISHIFKDVTGFTVNEYIQYRRVIEAQKMLKDPDADIAAVCFDAGFKTIQHFYRVFKKIAKTTPSRYQKVMAALHPR